MARVYVFAERCNEPAVADEFPSPQGLATPGTAHYRQEEPQVGRGQALVQPKALLNGLIESILVEWYWIPNAIWKPLSLMASDWRSKS